MDCPVPAAASIVLPKQCGGGLCVASRHERHARRSSASGLHKRLERNYRTAIAELQALTFSTTPTRAQVQALRNEVVDTQRILNDSLRELKDANQSLQDVRRILGALYMKE
jgi:septal ring factor EnvC (AmiA/AmiB activator)